MNISLPILWLFWDPDPVVWITPFIDWPIRWYGLFFAVGFGLGYIVVQQLLKKIILFTSELKEAHIAHWDRFLRTLQDSSSKQLTAFIPASIRNWISNYRQGMTVTPRTRTIILEGINQALRQRIINRKWIESSFSNSLRSAGNISQGLCDSLTWYVVLSTIIGARLGHVVFYEWEYYAAHPASILKTWEGGLASHGGAIAIPIGLYLFYRQKKIELPTIPFVGLLDLFSVAVPLGGFWIRIGNFFNQEIVGTPSTLPWAVVFGHPYQGYPGIPYHPVQIYEALSYALISLILWEVWKRSKKYGVVSGMMFLLLFGSRFALEFFKQHQGGLPEYFPLQMGQLLSIPGILLGFSLLFYSIRLRKNSDIHPVLSN